jgi:hypothetical protein
LAWILPKSFTHSVMPLDRNTHLLPAFRVSSATTTETLSVVPRLRAASLSARAAAAGSGWARTISAAAALSTTFQTPSHARMSSCPSLRWATAMCGSAETPPAFSAPSPSARLSARTPPARHLKTRPPRARMRALAGVGRAVVHGELAHGAARLREDRARPRHWRRKPCRR